MNLQPWTLICAALLFTAACGDGNSNHGGEGGTGGTGGTGGDGGTGGEGGTATGCSQDNCCSQADCPNGSDISRICLPDGCTDVGLRDEDDNIRRGSMIIGITTNGSGVDARTINSGYVRILHPMDTSGETIDCNRIYDTPDRLDSTLNVIRYSTFSVSTSLSYFAGILPPLNNMLVNHASSAYLVHVALFSGERNSITYDPTGNMVVEGCLGGMVVPDGTVPDKTDPNYYMHTFGTMEVTRDPSGGR